MLLTKCDVAPRMGYRNNRKTPDKTYGNPNKVQVEITYQY